ncbi:hypothetical protein N0V94_002971, partial [Neodidymelliopsis sp. IMI 364377]
LGFLCPALPQHQQHQHRQHRQRPRQTSRRSYSRTAAAPPPPRQQHATPVCPRAAGDAADALFIRALVRAASCPQHAHHTHTHTHTHTLHTAASRPPQQHAPRRRHALGPGRLDDQRSFTATAEHSGPLNRAGQFAKKELKAMVDYYGIQLDSPPHDKTFVDDDASPLIWNVGDSHEPWPLRRATDFFHIRRLKKLLLDDESPHDLVFDTYKLLPAPGVVYLDTDTIRILLRHLSVVERPSPLAMQRFMSVLDDMKTAHIHISKAEWTTAIHFAGRCMGRVTDDEVQSALHMWRDMERRAGVRAGYVTLNVLFNISVKAGKYTLAETFVKELHARNFKLHRHFRVSLLYYYGILRDGNGVRRTYQELVEAGDIVDTAVLNAVVAALFRAGEPSAAEHVFERMKRLHAAKRLPAPGHRFFVNNWRDRRAVGLFFTHQAQQLKAAGKQDELKQLQDYAPIAPNSRTYALLIRYHATVAGDIDRVYELLHEMQATSVRIEGTAFIVMFQGFAAFGGVRYSSWTADKLEKIWAQFVVAVTEKSDRVWLSRMAIIAALKAFKRCTDPERTLSAWEEIQPLWQPNEEELESVMQELRRGDVQPGFFSKNVRGRMRN